MDGGTYTASEAPELTHAASTEMDYGMSSADRLVSSYKYITVCETITFPHFKIFDGNFTIPFLPTTISLSATRENLRAKDKCTIL